MYYRFALCLFVYSIYCNLYFRAVNPFLFTFLYSVPNVCVCCICIGSRVLSTHKYTNELLIQSDDSAVRFLFIRVESMPRCATLARESIPVILHTISGILYGYLYGVDKRWRERWEREWKTQCHIHMSGFHRLRTVFEQSVVLYTDHIWSWITISTRHSSHHSIESF